MMLKIKKSNFKLLGIIACGVLLSLSYVSLSFYSIPEKASAIATWFPNNTSLVPDTYTIKDIKYLQEMNKTICDNSVGQNITEAIELEDLRDGNKYTVQVLADNKCWMTQNLSLGSLGSTKELSGDDTNLADGNTYTLPQAITGGFSNTMSGGYYTNQQVYINTDTVGIYGAYYSHNAATAGSTATSASGVATQDICPKGWRLPTGSSSGEFYALAAQYPAGTLTGTGNTKGWVNASNTVFGSSGVAGRWLGAANASTETLPAGGAFFPATGYIGTSGPSDLAGTEGRYWTGSISSASNAYSMRVNNSGVNPASTDSRYCGAAVRCIANEKVLTSKSYSGTLHTETITGSVAVQVASTISIDAISGMEKIVDSTEVVRGTISATISANVHNYVVMLSAAETSLMPENPLNLEKIPASSNVEAGTNAWGIWKQDGTYEPITTKATSHYHINPENTTDTPGTIYQFIIGVSVSPTLPADRYSTVVTVTAAAI